MKVPLPLVGLLSNLDTFLTAWNKVNKKQLGWFDHRKTFAGVLAMSAIIYSLYSIVEELNTDNHSLSQEIKTHVSTNTRYELTMDYQNRLIEESQQTIESQRDYIIELERTIAGLKMTNKDLELEIAGLERLLVAASTRQQEAEARLKEYLHQWQRAQQLTSDQRNQLHRRFNSLQN